PKARASTSGRYSPDDGDQYPVPLASLRSVVSAVRSVLPASRQVSQSWGKQTAAVRFAFSGSLRASQRSLVIVKLATGTVPIACAHALGPASASPSSPINSSASPAERVSFQSKAGRTTSPPA